MEVKLFLFQQTQVKPRHREHLKQLFHQPKINKMIGQMEAKVRKKKSQPRTTQTVSLESDLSETSLIRILFCFSQLTFCDSTNKTVISFLQSSVKVKHSQQIQMKTDPVRTQTVIRLIFRNTQLQQVNCSTVQSQENICYQMFLLIKNCFDPV